MRRSASEVLKSLEMRVARLEKSASRDLEKVLDKYLYIVKSPSLSRASFTGENELVTKQSYEGQMPRRGGEKSTVAVKSYCYMYVLLDEEETPNLCSRIKSKDPSLKGELNKFFVSKSGRISKVLTKRGVVDSLKEHIFDWQKESERSMPEYEEIRLDKWLKDDIGAISGGYEIVRGKCYVVVSALAQQSAQYSVVEFD